MHGVFFKRLEMATFSMVFLHVLDVLLQAHPLAVGLGGFEAKEFGQLGSVGRIFDQTQLDAFAELLPEFHIRIHFFLLFFVVFLVRLLFVGILVVALLLFGVVLLLVVLGLGGLLGVLGGFLGEFAQHFEALAHELLAHDLQHLVLLKGLTGDVQRQVVGVDDARDEVEVLGKQILELVGDQNLAHIQTQAGRTLVVVIVLVVGRFLGHEQDGLELDLALRLEVGPGGRVGLVFGDGLVEVIVIFVGDVFLVTRPDGLLLVDEFPVPHSPGLGFVFDLLLVILIILVLGVKFVIILIILIVLVVLVVFIIPIISVISIIPIILILILILILI